MSTERSPLAPAAFPGIGGETLRIARAHYKKWDRCDLTYVELAAGTNVASVLMPSIADPRTLSPLPARR